MFKHDLGLFVPQKEQLRYHFQEYAKRNSEKLSAGQVEMLNRYAENLEIMQNLVDSYWVEYWDNFDAGRKNLTLEAWTIRAIEQLVDVFPVRG